MFGFIYTDLSFFLPKVQGLSNFWMGVTIGVMAISLVLASFPLGILADRYGRRRMLFLGNIAASLSLIGFALTANLALVLLVAAVEGIGEAAFAVSGSALLADKAGDQKRTLAFSLIAFLGWIAGAIGGFAVSSVIVLQTLGLNVAQAHIALYLIVGLLGLSVTPLILKIQETPRYSGQTRLERKGVLPRKSAKVLIRFSTYSVMIAVGAGLFVPLMANWFFHAYGVTDAVSGPVLGFSSILTAVAVFLSPRLASKFGLIQAIVLSQGLSTVFMAVVPISPSFGIAASVYTVRVFLMNLSNPLSQSLIMGLVSPDERGMASGISASLWRLPNALSSTVGAIWIGMGLLALPFYVATVLYVSAIISFWFLFKGTRLPEESREITQPLAPSIQEETTATL
ncbi:MFS transporter [Candidatus Bathyarchaeota archaeon]|nr:MAG: MFS transporter [Candidatus Bathyarchaeota archaeon]